MLKFFDKLMFLMLMIHLALVGAMDNHPYATTMNLVASDALAAIWTYSVLVIGKESPVILQ